MKCLGLNAICVGKMAILRAILPIYIIATATSLWGGARMTADLSV